MKRNTVAIQRKTISRDVDTTLKRVTMDYQSTNVLKEKVEKDELGVGRKDSRKDKKISEHGSDSDSDSKSSSDSSNSGKAKKQHKKKVANGKAVEQIERDSNGGANGDVWNLDDI